MLPSSIFVTFVHLKTVGPSFLRHGGFKRSKTNCAFKHSCALHVFQNKTRASLEVHMFYPFAELNGMFPLPKPVIRWQMGTCSYFRNRDTFVGRCVNPRGMVHAAPSRDSELVKPAGLHVVEGNWGDNLVLLGNTCPIHALTLSIHVFPAHSYEAYQIMN